jgi:hypothetical protein
MGSEVLTALTALIATSVLNPPETIVRQFKSGKLNSRKNTDVSLVTPVRQV